MDWILIFKKRKKEKEKNPKRNKDIIKDKSR